MTSEAQMRAQKRYQKLYTRSFLLKYNTRTDADVIEALERQASKQDYVRRLIREDVRKCAERKTR